MDVIVVLGVFALALYTLIKDVLSPLVKRVLKTKLPATERETVSDSRLAVLEVNLTAVTAQVVSFDKLLSDTSIAIDNKIDLVLVELKELREEQAEAHRNMIERISRAETHIEHLLGPARHSGH
jgi:hypothetical protein